MKLSIIVPIYQVEYTIRRCIDSIISQTFSDWELFLIDDGSPDQCGVICDEYALKDERIHVIHQENRGLSEARNAGLKMAQGEYVTFIDSDDFISIDTLERVMSYTEKEPEVEIIEYPIMVHYGHYDAQEMVLAPVTYSDARSYWIDGQAYTHTYAANKIYRRYLFKDIAFPKGYKFEDAWTLPLLLKKDPMVMTVSEGMYFYCWNEEGITVQASGDDLTLLLNAHIKASEVLSIPFDDNDAALWYLHTLNIQLDVCRLCGVAPILQHRRLPFSVASSMNERIKILVLNTLGLKALCWMKKHFS